MISAGAVAAIAVLGLLGLIALSLLALLRAPTPHDRIAAALAIWAKGVLLVAACGIWAGAGPGAVIAAGAAFFAGLIGLVAAIKLARHSSLAAALARPNAALSARQP